VFPLTSADDTPRGDPPGVRIERVESERGMRDVVGVQETTWGCEFAWLLAALSSAIRERPRETSIYCAYAGDRPVGSGWIDFPSRSSFAELHGGAVPPEFRGRGIYSRLFRERREEAARRGIRYLAVDAAPMRRVPPAGPVTAP